jgi:hypothetical protein
MGALASTFLAGLAFTSYVSVYGASNLVGHYFHLLAFFFLYLALIRSSMTRPYGTLFRELSTAREAASRREQFLNEVKFPESTRGFAGYVEQLCAQLSVRSGPAWNESPSSDGSIRSV